VTPSAPILLIDYGAGNVRSVQRALEEAGRRAGVERPVLVSRDPDMAAKADRIVLPGQGAFGDCMASLASTNGLIEALRHAVVARGRPFLGICVGMQLLAGTGLEHGATAGLGWLGGVCRPLEARGDVRVPHMGWNEARVVSPHPVLAPLAPAQHMYFAHSFVLDPKDPSHALAECEHGETFCAAAGSDTVLGVQFHPEKSQAAGLALLAAFLDWNP
jgi:glutamine amidotransferase